MIAGRKRSSAAWLAGLLLAPSALAAAYATPALASKRSTLRVEASFYPLRWVAKRVGGEHVRVTSLTPPGAEPHDLELSARRVARIADADAVVYLRGFQPAVDDAVRNLSAHRRFDAANATTLDVTSSSTGEHDDEGHDHDREARSVDPHFWLDPTKLAEVADELATFLADLDPEHAEAYATRAETLRRKLTTLDMRYETSLVGCRHNQLVTSHSAFGYLARRYGMEQVGITNLSPEEEPSPRDLAEVADVVRRNDIRTIYFETLVPTDIARTVARETGARTDVLDPIEGLNDRSQGRNYLRIMRANLRNLEKGQPCP